MLEEELSTLSQLRISVNRYPATLPPAPEMHLITGTACPQSSLVQTLQQSRTTFVVRSGLEVGQRMLKQQ